VLLRDAGAYGFTMASEYNGRALPAEVFVSGGVVTEVFVPRRVDAWVAERLGRRET
jgi:diaminopimelate decarboxylase